MCHFSGVVAGFRSTRSLKKSLRRTINCRFEAPWAWRYLAQLKASVRSSWSKMSSIREKWSISGSTAIIANVITMLRATNLSYIDSWGAERRWPVTMTHLLHASRLRKNLDVLPKAKNRSTFNFRYLQWKRIAAMKRLLWLIGQVAPSCTLISDRRPSYTRVIKAPTKRKSNTKTCVPPGWARSFRSSTSWRFIWSMTGSLKEVRVNAWTFL